MPTFLTAFGETKTLLEWTHDPRCIVSLATLLSRVRDQWAPEKALTTESNSPADRWRTPIHAFGESKTLLEWERDDRSQASAQTILKRLRSGWTPEEAISAPVPEADGLRKPKSQRTYFGKTLNELMKDPRCSVSRYTLERNLRARMPLEEALVYRKRQRSVADTAAPVETVEQAMTLMRTGELWQYLGGSQPRVSILCDGSRYEVPFEVFEDMVQQKLIRLVSSSDTTREYECA